MKHKHIVSLTMGRPARTDLTFKDTLLKLNASLSSRHLKNGIQGNCLFSHFVSVPIFVHYPLGVSHFVMYTDGGIMT